MDSVTQVVLGAGVGELALGRKIGNRALLWGGIAGTLPDLDVFFTLGDPIREIVIHRGFSHSITFAVLASPILAWAMGRLYRNKNLDVSWRQWTWFFFLTIFTHPLLDCLTTYGTQLFYPFTDYRVSTSSVFVVDLAYTVPFMATLVIAAFLKRESVARARWAAFGMLYGSLYLFAGLINKQIAGNFLEKAAISQGITFKNHMVGVTPLNILLWYGVFETDSSYHVAYHSLLDPPNMPVRFIEFEKQHSLADAWRNEYGIDRIIWFGQKFWIARKNGDVLELFTLKFGLTGFDAVDDPQKAFRFYYTARKNDDGTMHYEAIRKTDEMDLKAALSRLFGRVLGRDVL